MTCKKTVLKNGLRVVTVPMKDNPTVTVMVLVEAGSKYETKKINGISHFLEHLCFKGTTKRPSPLHVTEELDGLGAKSNAFTGNEYTGYWAKAQAKQFPKLLDIISDIYLDPLLPDDEIQREKGVIIDEMNMYEDMPMRQAWELYFETLHGDQPAGWPVLGTKEIITNMTRDEIVQYREKYYTAPATVVVVSGNIPSHASVVKSVEKSFEGMADHKKGTKKKTVTKQQKVNLSVKYKKTDQAHIRVGVRTCDMKNDKKYTYLVMAGLLGKGMSSRLFQKIRNEMGIGYYVAADSDHDTDNGSLIAFTGVTPEKAVDATAAIMSEFTRLTEEEIAPSELKKVKDHITGTSLMELESSSSLGQYFGFQELLEGDVVKPQEVMKKIRAVTAKDIKKAARAVMKDEKLNVAIIGPFRDSKRFEKILTFKK